jgi:hypothetical protein
VAISGGFGQKTEYQDTGLKQLLYHFTRHERDNSVEILENHYAVSDIQIYKTILTNKIIKNKGKLAEELYAFRAGDATRDLIFGVRRLIEKNWNMENCL